MPKRYKTLEEEILEKMQELKDDPVAWIEYFTDSNEGVSERAHLPVLHDGQKRWIINSTKKINALSAANRWGKSVATAKKHIYYLMTKRGVELEDYKAWLMEDYKTLNCAPTSDLSEKIWNIVEALMRLPRLRWGLKSMAKFPNKIMTFWNGSQFHCETTKNKARAILGEKYRYASFDECDFEPYFEYVVKQVLMQRLLDYDGTLDLTSTPDGKMHFYREFRKADPDRPESERSPIHYSQYGSISDNPYIQKSAIEQLKRAIPVRLHAQHLEGKFIDSEKAVFTAAQIERLIDPSLPFITPPVSGHRYVVGYDLARKEDYMCGYVIDMSTTPFTVVYRFYEAYVPWSMAKHEIRATQRLYNADLVIDATGSGDVVMDELDDIADGFMFTERSKNNLLLNLQIGLDYGRKVDEHGNDLNPNFGILRSPAYPELIDELAGYRHDDRKLPTDNVMALAMALRQGWEGDVIPVGETAIWQF